MTDHPTPAAGDREQGPVGLLARLFLTQLLAVLAVAAVIATVFALVEREGTTGRVTGSTTSTPPPAGSATPAPATTPPASSSTPSPGTPTATTATTATAPKVDVLNQSAGGGFARRTAERLRGRGWRIGRVDDFRGTVRTTTVYYPPGERDAARALVQDLPGSPRLLERFDSLSPSRLSVVLVD